MREIKFKALVKYPRKDAVWIYYSPLSIPHAFYAQNDDNADNRAVVMVKNLEYAGVNDRNQKEIYEGDVMVSSNNKPKTEMIGEVYFEGGQFRVQYKNRYPKEGDRKDFYLSSGFDGSNWEVIGNVYENPELLKA